MLKFKTTILAAALFSALAISANADAIVAQGVNGCGATAVQKGSGAIPTIDYNTGNSCVVAASPGGYPTAATPIIGIGTGTTGAVVGTLAGATAKTTYICGFDVSGIGGTAALGPIVVAGLLTGSYTYQLSSTAAGVTLSKTFTPCIPASAVNTAITVTTTADGSASAVDVNATGFQQ